MKQINQQTASNGDEKLLTTQDKIKTINAEPMSWPEPTLASFNHSFRTVNNIRLHYVEGGNKEGKAVVLLPGFPESWFAWRKIMPLLSNDFRVIALDLPGQGDSDRPMSGYDTKTIAIIIHKFLQQLDIQNYYLAAHDVGGWVAYPYTALFGDEVDGLAIMDAGIPGITMPDKLSLDPELAWQTWHFAFHLVPDIPEMLITGKESEYLDWFLRRKAANPEVFSNEDIKEYLRGFKKMGGLRAGLSYYRDSALSAQQNKELAKKGKLKTPVLALGGDQSTIPDMVSPLKDFVQDIQGSTIQFCGHFLPEEQPEVVANELINFFKNHD